MQVAQLAVTLIAALAWPIVIVLVLLYFGRELRDFVKNANEMRLKFLGVESTFTRQLQSVAALTAAAAAQRAGGDAGPQGPILSEAELRHIADTVSEASTPAAARRLSGSSVLWVDDRPRNNTYERNALEALGIRFTISTSTEDALEKIRSKRYDAIISDMGRPPDSQAGYTLLEQLRREEKDISFIIYAESNLPEHKVLARKKGALGSTNDPQELYDLVIAAILGDRT